MAYILVRMDFTEAVRRSSASVDFLKGRIELVRSTCEGMGFELIDLCQSVSTGETVWILKGSADDVIVLQRLMYQTGSYTRITAEVLEPSEALIAAHDRAQSFAAGFVPPDRDEIDRMLLDE